MSPGDATEKRPRGGDSVLARIGIISDTHGSLHSSIHAVFAGVDHIVHAGDLGGEAILLELEAIAPVTAVLGNTDHALPGRNLAHRASVRIVGATVAVTHDARGTHGDVPPAATVMVSGHTHRPEVVNSHGVLHVNPGSASRPRQADGQRTVALLEIMSSGALNVRILPLIG